MRTTYEKHCSIWILLIIMALLMTWGILLFTPRMIAYADDEGAQEDELITDLWWGLKAGKLTLSKGETDATHNKYSLYDYILVDGQKVYPAWYGDRDSIVSVTVVGTPTAPQSLYSWFDGCSNLINVALIGLDTSNVTDMNHMFNGCIKLTSLDLSPLDTSNVEDMSYMFGGCSKLTSLDLSPLDISNVTNMAGMFSYCSDLQTLKLSDFKTSRVTNMAGMFANCYELTSLDLSNFDTSNVTSMADMFSSCSGLTSLDLSNFNTSNVTDMDWMFADCYALTSLDLSNFNTEKVTDMSYMFNCCLKLTSLDLSSFNTLKVTESEDIFSDCYVLNEIKTPAIVGATALPLPCRFVYKTDENKYAPITSIASENVKTTIYRHAKCTSAEAVREKEVSATCMKAGSYDEVVYCSEYGEELSRTPITTEIDPDNHNWDNKAWVFDESQHWRVCLNDGCAQRDSIGAHIPSDWIKNATCTEEGSKRKECTVCNTVLESEQTVAALGHNYGEWTVVKEATETEEGEERRVCANDDTHYESRPLPKITKPAKIEWWWIFLLIALALIVAGEVSYLVYRRARKNKSANKNARENKR